MDVTRRNLITILGVAPAAAAAQTQAGHEHAAPAAPAKKAYVRKVFNDQQWRSVRVLCDLIIPGRRALGQRHRRRCSRVHRRLARLPRPRGRQ